MPQGVIHRRRVLLIPPETWLVVDDFRGSGDHTFEVHYHFPPDVELSDMHRCLIASSPLTTARIEGWMSRAYGETKPCTILRATFAGPVPASAMTFLLPDKPCDAVVRQLTVESGSGIACSYKHDGFEDIAVLSTADSETAVADFRMRGEFFCLRLEGGVLKQVLAVRAGSLDCGGRNIFRRSEPGPYSGAIDGGMEEKRLCAEFAGS